MRQADREHDRAGAAEHRPKQDEQQDPEEEVVQRREDIRRAHDERVDLAAERTREHAHERADDGRGKRRQHRDLQRDPYAVDDPREQIATDLVGAHDVRRRRRLEHAVEVDRGVVERGDDVREQRHEHHRDEEARSRRASTSASDRRLRRTGCATARRSRTDAPAALMTSPRERAGP